MQKIILFFIISSVLSGCYSADTITSYNPTSTWARSQSKPVYLSFRDTKTTPFYFLLGHDSKEQDYKISVRWRNAKKDAILFNGLDTTLKFLVNNSKIFTFKPIYKPKIVAYNINTNTREEEGLFSIPAEQFRDIAYAKSVTVEIDGRGNTVIGTFSRRNTFRAFREFFESSP